MSGRSELGEGGAVRAGGSRDHDAARPLISLARVCKSYDGHGVALCDLSVTIERGSFVTVVGDSGSGKTTLLKTINRLIEPDAGSVMIGGQDVRRIPGHVLRLGIGYVFQQIGLFPHMTVAENMAVAPRLLGWPPSRIAARVRELVELIGMSRSWLTRMPAQLSGGQRQRVGVARALAASPSILLMDEPFGALDPLTRDTLGTELRRLHEDLGLTTVMVTHDVLEAVLLSDRIIVMRGGAIIADGEPHELLDLDADPEVRALMSVPRRQAERVSALIAQRAGVE